MVEVHTNHMIQGARSLQRAKTDYSTYQNIHMLYIVYNDDPLGNQHTPYRGTSEDDVPFPLEGYM